MGAACSHPAEVCFRSRAKRIFSNISGCHSRNRKRGIDDMTLKELGPCDHVRRGDRVIEFELKARPPLSDTNNRKLYHAICPSCSSYMRWENWANLSEPLRAICTGCDIRLQSTELNLQPEEKRECEHGTESASRPNPS